MVQRWKWMKIQAQSFAPVPCSECGTSNQAGEVFCVTCGAPFLLNRIKGKIMPSRVGRKLLAAWIVMVGTIAGVLMALVLNNGGGAWDNAKKYIETGVYGGKKSDAHKAAVVGDTVGDPFKDTAGPSLHVLIKLLSTITLVLAPLFIR